MTVQQWRDMIARRMQNTGEDKEQAITHLRREIARHFGLSEDDGLPFDLIDPVEDKA